jgi:arylamine N-acetyltransferase
VSIIKDDRVLAIRNRVFSVYDTNGARSETIADAARMHALLSERFQLAVSGEESRALFAMVAKPDR